MSSENRQSSALIFDEDPSRFDPRSGTLFERMIFNHRAWFILICLLVTAFLGFQAAQLGLNSSYSKTLPQDSDYIQNFLKYKKDLPQLGNLVHIVVETDHGTIYDAHYMKVLHKVVNEVASLPGVNLSGVESLWSPTVRYQKVTPKGFQGGQVMPNDYNGSRESLNALRRHAQAAHLRGRLVGNDLKSSMVVLPLVKINPETGKPLDYQSLSHALDNKIRPIGGQDIHTHIIGFAKLQGDLIDHVGQVMGFFLIAAFITGLIVFFYNRCVRSTLVLLVCSIIAVVWELGIVHILGFYLNPYSVLVPFLVFAIGVSHGSQKMNGIMQDIGRGASQYVAARYTFRRIFLAGLTALLADVVGFAVLMVIDIPVIQDLAITASIGVGVLIFTNLLLLPVTLSYIGVSKTALKHNLKAEGNYGSNIGINKLWNLMQHLTERRWAVAALCVGAALFATGVTVSQHLTTGALVPGASSLRPDSTYNQDVAYVNEHYSASSDQFAIFVKTPPHSCSDHSTLMAMDRLGWRLRQQPHVLSTSSLARKTRQGVAGRFEGNPKWLTLVGNPQILEPIAYYIIGHNPNASDVDCSLSPLIAYLTDHKAATLKNVLGTVENFAAKHNSEDLKFLPVAGTAGVQAVVNRSIRHSSDVMLYYVYAAVVLLCLIAFRSWRATIVAIVPLIITSSLAEAIMVMLGIGVQVSTLPVIALGVGIGVDYALYLLSVQMAEQRQGTPLKEAYRRALHFTGKVVALVGITLAAGVITWVWSPIRFQADMGILLTFMFLWNMIGALLLIPALSHFLLRNVKPKPGKQIT